jgi:hypothetical protein
MLMEVQLALLLLLVLGDPLKLGANLAQAPLQGGVVDVHGIDAVSV